MDRLLFGCLIAGLLSVSCSAQERRPVADSSHGDRLEAGDLVYSPPSPDNIPGDQRGEQIRLGYEIVAHTQEYAKAYLGNSLSCTNCHLDAGLNPNAAPFVGLSAVYPEYRPRAARVMNLSDRINECFERSLNGRALPPDSSKLEAVVAYITWLSEGIPAGSQVPWRGLARITATRPPDPANGKKLFATKCSFCHGADGGGTMSAPPVWGPRSFNIGADMARSGILASFIKANMPRGWGWSLSDDEAYDVATFVAGQPRPDFRDKQSDWPKGGKPPDVAY